MSYFRIRIWPKKTMEFVSFLNFFTPHFPSFPFLPAHYPSRASGYVFHSNYFSSQISTHTWVLVTHIVYTSSVPCVPLRLAESKDAQADARKKFGPPVYFLLMRERYNNASLHTCLALDASQIKNRRSNIRSKSKLFKPLFILPVGARTQSTEPNESVKCSTSHMRRIAWGSQVRH